MTKASRLGASCQTWLLMMPSRARPAVSSTTRHSSYCFSLVRMMPVMLAASFEEDESEITVVTGLGKGPFPFRRRHEGAAGPLPIHQIGLLALVAIGLDGQRLRAPADALHLFQRSLQVIGIEIVERVDRHDEVEAGIGIGQAR